MKSTDTGAQDSQHDQPASGLNGPRLRAFLARSAGAISCHPVAGRLAAAAAALTVLLPLAVAHPVQAAEYPNVWTGRAQIELAGAGVAAQHYAAVDKAGCLARGEALARHDAAVLGLAHLAGLRVDCHGPDGKITGTVWASTTAPGQTIESAKADTSTSLGGLVGAAMLVLAGGTLSARRAEPKQEQAAAAPTRGADNSAR